MNSSRRWFLGGLIAAPAIVRAASLMPVRSWFWSGDVATEGVVVLDELLLSPWLITRETLAILENNLIAASKIHRRFEDQFVRISGLYVRKPLTMAV